jgi:hypothetical protein
MVISVQKVTNMNLQTTSQQRQAVREIPETRTDVAKAMLRSTEAAGLNVKTAGKTGRKSVAMDRAC